MRNAKNHQATPEQIAHIEALVMRSRFWFWFTTTITRTLCQVLGYPWALLQPPHVWARSYSAALISAHEKKLRADFVLLKNLSRCRSGIIMLLIYLAAQHARLQFHAAASAAMPTAKNGIPCRVLDRHHRSVTRMLTRLLSAAVGCLDDRYYGRGWHVRVVRRALRICLGCGQREISTHAVLRWVSVADRAAGVVSRLPDTLQHTHTSAEKVRLSLVMLRYTIKLLREAYWASPWIAAKSALLALGYVCLLGYLVRGIAMGVHTISHLHP